MIEEFELTNRIARRYAVVFNPKVKVAHEFEDFWPIAKKYFLRAYYWTKLYQRRKKFDPVATTGKEAITTISAAGLVGSVVLWLGVRSLGQIGLIILIGIENWLLVVSCGLLVIHLWGVRKFLGFCVKEEGIVFAIKAFFTGIVLYIIILSGAFLSTFYSPGKDR